MTNDGVILNKHVVANTKSTFGAFQTSEMEVRENTVNRSALVATANTIFASRACQILFEFIRALGFGDDGAMAALFVDRFAVRDTIWEIADWFLALIADEALVVIRTRSSRGVCVFGFDDDVFLFGLEFDSTAFARSDVSHLGLGDCLDCWSACRRWSTFGDALLAAVELALFLKVLFERFLAACVGTLEASFVKGDIFINVDDVASKRLFAGRATHNIFNFFKSRCFVEHFFKKLLS